MWTSNSSTFQTTSRTITRTAVHSGDTGTHTCTATDGAGRSGSTSVVFTIVGELPIMIHYCVLYLKGGELINQEHNVSISEFLYVLNWFTVASFPGSPHAKKKDGEVKEGEPGHIYDLRMTRD